MVWDGDVGVVGRWVVCKIMKLEIAHRWEKYDQHRIKPWNSGISGRR